MQENIREILETYYAYCHNTAFLEDDPLGIPHQFSLQQDKEIMGFFAAILAWGQRKTIIQNCKKISAFMDEKPYDFILHHSDKDLIPLQNFVHRTFNSSDLLSVIAFFKSHYRQNVSLETAFTGGKENVHPEQALIHFHHSFFSLESSLPRTKKHISTPEKKSTCKRLNMFLRWMVRKDDKGIDFGIWNNIRPADLLCPLDVHVEKNARKLGLIERPQTDWLTVLELSNVLKQIDPIDPIRFDFALFGMGILEKNGIQLRF